MPERRRKVLVDGSVPSVPWSVLFSSIGEVVEWFDFIVYASLAPVLARVFFAADSRSSLLRGVFGARPILLAGQFPVSRSAASLRGADPK
jgi:hypothetical protein